MLYATPEYTLSFKYRPPQTYTCDVELNSASENTHFGTMKSSRLRAKREANFGKQVMHTTVYFLNAKRSLVVGMTSLIHLGS